MNIILKQIKDNINDFVYTAEIFNKMKNTLNDQRFRCCTVCIKIYNNELSVLLNDEKFEKRRKQHIIKLIESSIKYHNNKNINFPNVLFYLYINDAYAYQHNDMPFFVMAKPLNKHGILIPDNTFVCHPNENKSCNWNEIVDACKKVNYDKENVMFFAGANTDKGRQNIRSGLDDLQKKNIKNLPLKILLEQPKLSLCQFKKFKYLLNLPGNQPWSYRFKYLFLMKSVVINVNVLQLYKGSKEYNKQWVNFFDCLFEKDVDYVNIDYYWKEDDDDFNKQSFNKMIDKLKQTYEYYESHDNEYKTMASSGYNKVNMISKKFIYRSIYMLFDEYSKKYDFTLLM